MRQSLLTCLGHLGQRDRDRIISIYVVPPKVAKASKKWLKLSPALSPNLCQCKHGLMEAANAPMFIVDVLAYTLVDLGQVYSVLAVHSFALMAQWSNIPFIILRFRVQIPPLTLGKAKCRKIEINQQLVNLQFCSINTCDVTAKCQHVGMYKLLNLFNGAFWRQNIQYNDTKHFDTQHIWINCDRDTET